MNKDKKIKQKPIKVKPKFNVGDWIVYYRDDYSREIIQIYDIRDGRYYFTDNVHFSWSVKECDEKSHLWTLQDAKDGDVLFVKQTENLGKQLIIFGEIDSDSRIKYYCRFLDNKFSVNDGLMGYDHECFLPATKEQCDFLFQKMHEAEYEWGAEKKELNKIKHRI